MITEPERKSKAQGGDSSSLKNTFSFETMNHIQERQKNCMNQVTSNPLYDIPGTIYSIRRVLPQYGFCLTHHIVTYRTGGLTPLNRIIHASTVACRQALNRAEFKHLKDYPLIPSLPDCRSLYSTIAFDYTSTVFDFNDFSYCNLLYSFLSI